MSKINHLLCSLIFLSASALNARSESNLVDEVIQILDGFVEPFETIERVTDTTKEESQRFSYKTGRYVERDVPPGASVLTLNQAFRTMLKHNDSLLNLKYSVLESDADFRSQKKSHRGDLGLRFIYNRNSSESGGIVDDSDGYENSNMFSAEVRYVFPWFHKNDQIATYEKAALQTEIYRKRYLKRVRELERELVRAYYESVLFERFVDIEKVSVKMARDRSAHIKSLYDMGKASNRDILSENNSLLEKQMLERTAKENALEKRNTLYELMGMTMNIETVIEDDLSLNHPLLDQTRALEEDWKAKTYSLEMKQKQLDMEQSDNWFEPQIALRAWYTENDSQDVEEQYSAGTVIHLPIPSLSENKRQKEAARISLEGLEQRAQQVESSRKRQITFLKQRLQRLKESLAMNTRLHRLRNEELKVAQSDFELGKITRRELQYIEESSSETERLFHQTVFEYVDTAAQLRIERGEHLFKEATRAGI